MSIAVDQPFPQVTEMCNLFDMVDALEGGTYAMRSKGRIYLPQFPMENDENYNYRLDTSVLLPVYSETVKNLVGKIFARPMTLKENAESSKSAISEQITEILASVDSEDRSFNALAMEATKMAVHYGISYLLVDALPAAGETQAESKTRPYITLINPRNVLGWKCNEAGDLTQVRIRSWTTEDDGDYGVKQVEVITVWGVDGWEKYEKTKDATTENGKTSDAQFSVIDSGTNPLGKIPLIAIYGKRTGFMTAEPPLLELAHLNIKHWQEWSDQSNILHVAKVPLLVCTGLDAEAAKEISVKTLTNLPVGSDMKYVEHSGKAIESGQKSLDDLVNLMRISGARMTEVKNGAAKTATQAREESSDNKSQLAVIAENVRDAFNIALSLLANWLGDKSGNGGEVDMNTDIDNDNMPIESLTILDKMVANGSLSRQTLFSEAKRRGLIDESLTWEDEQARISGDNQSLENGY